MSKRFKPIAVAVVLLLAAFLVLWYMNMIPGLGPLI